MFENVKNLVSKKFIDDFNNLLGVLDELGFNSYWEVLNAKDCGVPQNRERVFVISIRKDIDKGKFEFSKPFDTGIRLKDIIDRNVDEKYYLSKDIQEQFVLNIEKYDSKNNIGYIPKEQIPTDNTINDCIQVGDLNHYNYDEMNRVYSKEGCSPTLNTMQGGDRQPRVLEQNEAGVVENFRVRTLTPCECMKLMGFTEEDCANAKNIGIADSQLYKQSGNGIVTNCVELLAEHLYKAQYDNTYKCTDENFI
jgi:DNA (cytosine-5)-methyltransferase 1